jgi:CubicO group peptidase (beta-lactamase class C family)
MTMNHKCIYFLICILLTLSSCTIQSNSDRPLSQQLDPAYPMPDWQTSNPAEQGMDSALLDQMMTDIDDTHLAIHSLLIIRNGKIVLEKYYPGHGRSELHPLYSVTKSFVSTLLGIAADQKKLGDLNNPVIDYFPDMDFDNPDPQKDSMTLENLLTMTAGLRWFEGDASYNALYRSDDWVKWMLDQPMVEEPSSTFKYCSGCSHILLKILEQSTGMDAVDFATQNLFKPLGIKKFEWERNPQADPIGGWGLSLTSRDMARLGYLYLHNGAWSDSQVVSASWVETATAQHVDPDGKLGYGYQWWTYPTHGAYAALGRFGQTIFVIPDQNVVIVFTADLPDNHDRIFNLIDNYIIPSVTNK